LLAVVRYEVPLRRELPSLTHREAHMPGMNARAVSKATLRPVIVRACVQCGGKREIGTPCALCGLADPPVTHDLGVQSAYYRNPLKRFGWWAVGQHLAAHRAREAATSLRQSGVTGE
jgi:hypothetical protein